MGIAIVMGTVLTCSQAFGQTGGLSGKCTGRDGSPLANFTVIIQRLDANWSGKTRTNRKGTYLYIGLAPGQYKITLVAPDHSPMNSVIRDVAPGDFTEANLEVGKTDVEAGKPQESPAVTPLSLPAAYVSEQAPADQLELKADNTFSLQEGGQAYHGTFAVNGDALELTIAESNVKTTATIQGKKLTDSSGQTWVSKDQPAKTASDGSMLQNEDVIKMVKAGRNDLFVIARINGSTCQFDTSADALIQLKQNGVSSAVIKAMIGAGK
jgi:hypothetical protein